MKCLSSMGVLLLISSGEADGGSLIVILLHLSSA